MVVRDAPITMTIDLYEMVINFKIVNSVNRLSIIKSNVIAIQVKNMPLSNLVVFVYSA